MTQPNEPVPRLRRILVATDLSVDARVALEAAVHLAPADDADLHVVHAVPEPDQPIEGAPATPEEGGMGDAAGPREEADDPARLARHVEEAGAPVEKVELHLQSGRAFRAIQSVAGEIDADLIVLGRHRPRRAFDGLLGSTAERVVRTTRVPCLLVNREIEAPPRTLMVASDLSPHADRALEVAVAWAAQWAGPAADRGKRASGGIAVELVHISDFARPGYRPLGRGEILRRDAEEASARMGPDVEVRSRTASYPLAPEGIFEVATDLKPDLVFIGTHGHGAVLRLLFGSVASELMRTLPLPLVLVPLPADR
jgi:universal stress protein E